MNQTLRWMVFLWALIAFTRPSMGQGGPKEFGWFGEMSGACWVGMFPDGKTRHKHCYGMQFNRFMRGTSELASVTEDKATVLFEGDSFFAWNATRGLIEYVVWGSDGSHRQLEARYDGEELAFPVPSRSDPGKIAFRSVWKRLSADQFEVRRERPEGDGWKVELRVTYSRKPLEPAVSRSP